MPPIVTWVPPRLVGRGTVTALATALAKLYPKIVAIPPAVTVGRKLAPSTTPRLGRIDGASPLSDAAGLISAKNAF